MIIRTLEQYDRLMDATALSLLLKRPRKTITTNCNAAACDIQTKRLLYAARAASALLNNVPTRVRTKAA